MVAPYSEFSATTCCLAAERALQHLKTNLPQIEKLLLSFQIHDYRIFAGFDEHLVQAEIGFLEQIHLFLSSEPAKINTLLSQLAVLFAPFSAIVFTKTSQHRIPLSTDETSRRRIPLSTNEVAQPYAFIDNLNRKSLAYPTAISISQSPGTRESANTFHPCGVANGQSSGGVNNPSRSTKEREEGNSADKHGGGDGDGDGDQGPDSWHAEIEFGVISDLVSSDPSPFQSLQVKGKLTITRTAEQPLNTDGYGFATCHIQFNELVMNNRIISEKPAYGHFHTTVVIDSLQETATINQINPLLTRQYQKDVKVASSSKRSWTLSASALIGAILLKPQLSFTGSAGRTSESGNNINIERMMNFDRITQIDMRGVVSWGFYITDCHEHEYGRTTPVDLLPSARFKFVGDDDTPAPPPKLIDVEVSTYFSLLPRHGSNNIPGNIWVSPNQISYSNFCQITALRIPSNLRGSHNYQAQLLVHPRLNKTSSTVTVDTQVKHDTKSITVNPLVIDSKRNFGNGIDDLLKDSTLELTAFRHVRRPVNKLPNKADKSTNVNLLVVDSRDSKHDFAGTGIDKDSALKLTHVQAPARAWIRPRSPSMMAT